MRNAFQEAGRRISGVYRNIVGRRNRNRDAAPVAAASAYPNG
ncbi:hypothetical protein [Rhodococcus sp. IEGM 1330]|nr:hypothetical protein [Rhodococcus sp. IEGM 1330]MDV8024954.1 hypothetical protein [Rhodococcus sp. IEGM 1330]